MRSTPFNTRKPKVDGNMKLRTPQREAFAELVKFAEGKTGKEREAGIILPVGCGKSGCITLAPFAFKSGRTLVVAPGLTIANQLNADFDPANPELFYIKSASLLKPPFPEPVEIRGTTANRTDLDEADVVITNIQQLQGTGNKWLQSLPADYFDLILFDEGHHNVAESWETLKTKFPDAKIVNFSATPLRADGQLMSGRVIYSYPIFRAIQEGYVKRLKAVVLNPRSLRYVRSEDGIEVDVSLAEVRRLGEEDPKFRRGILTSKETLDTIVDASIRELQKLQTASGEKRLKIIASALNYDHCAQVVAAYRSRGLRSDYVHSREDGPANARVLKKLENHELDVIVQVRKLGEGFDHPYLAVAAVFNVFSNLSPFVQFVGRIMRVIKQNSPGDPVNHGVVVFHAGANIARRWKDFQNYSEADQEFFDQLLPLETLDFENAGELEIEPRPGGSGENQVLIKGQAGVQLQEIQLIKDDPEALEALRVLQARGYTSDQVAEAMADLQPVPITKVRQRQAMRDELDQRIRTEAARILAKRKVNAEGRNLDTKHIGQSNLIVMKAAIDREINGFVNRKSGQRHELSREELEKIILAFPRLLEKAEAGVFNGKT
jgi:superfamily II DNA or RNA helicase